VSAGPTAAGGRLRAYVEAHGGAVDVALGGFATIVAGLLRLIRLGDIPYGVHPDEAQFGLDAIRITQEGWIGVYSRAALGVPTLNDYLITPGVWLWGRTAFALRIDMALVGLAAVPLLYALVRVAYGRAEAFFASMLLAVSYWHLLYSRVAHMSISYPTLLLAALLCMMVGLRRGGDPRMTQRRVNPQRTRRHTERLGHPPIGPMGADRSLAAGGVGSNPQVTQMGADAGGDAPVLPVGTGVSPAGHAADGARARRGLWAERMWFAAAGVFLGLSVYAYNIGAIVPAAAVVFLVVLTVTKYRSRAALARWWPSAAICVVVALVVALPFLWYISDPNAYFWEHIRTYRDVGVTRTPEYRDADYAGKARIIVDQLRTFAGTYIWRGVPDIVDASGQRPIFDPVTLVLLAAGLVLAFRARGEPLVLAAVSVIVIVPLPAVLQEGSMMREPLGAAPFAMFIAALPLAAAWRWAWARGPGLAAIGAAAAIAPVLAIGGLTLHDYFWSFRTSELTRFVYHQQITSASLYMKTLPPNTYVLFYSERFPLALETRQYLAPGVQGEDRSREFSGADGSTALPARGGRVAFVLLGEYLPLLPEIERAYPDGVERTVVRDGRVDMYAYLVAVE